MLATSREPLGIPAELVWSVPPLPVPRDAEEPLTTLAAVPAVQLFVTRAQAAQRDFTLDDENCGPVAELCIRLDGVPLAIELAAARMRSMSPAELVERLPERFRVLAGTRRATDPRHRTLRDLVQWSYELLAPIEQTLFDRLSIFAGSFALERAEQVCAGDDVDARDVAGLLGALVDKSMVVVRARRCAGALSLVGDPAGVRPRAVARFTVVRGRRRAAHAAEHAELAEDAELGLGGPDEGRWMEELEVTFDDMREAHSAAVEWVMSPSRFDWSTGLREYAFRRMRYEVVSWADLTLALPGAPEHRAGPIAIGMIAYGHFVRGELETAVEAGEQRGRGRGSAPHAHRGTRRASTRERALLPPA